MKKVWKVLAAAAAVVALTPYKVDRDEETGETKVKALFWGAKYTPKTDESDAKIDVGLNLLPDIPGLLGQETEDMAGYDDHELIDETDLYDDSVILVEEALSSDTVPIAETVVVEAAPVEAVEETPVPESDPA